MDPRFRARRVAVRRSEGRRRLRRLVTLLVVAGALGLVYLITRSPLLDVDHVRVTGAENAGTDTVLAAAGIDIGSPMTDAPVAAAHDRVAALPWIESVEVNRKWPGSIDIRVVERVAAGVLLTPDGTHWLIDGTGRVIAPVEGKPAELPAIVLGAVAVPPGAHQPGIDAALAVGRLLTPDLLAWVAAIQPAPDGTVDLVLQQSIHVDLGSQAHLSDKLIDLSTVLTRVELAEMETIDVSVVHNPVVTRKQV